MAKYIALGGLLALLLLGSAYLPIGVVGVPQETLVPQKSFSHSHGLSVDVADADKLYIATHEGLYLLENEQELFRVGKKKDDLMGFTAHPRAGGTFFSSGHSALGGNIGFQKTMDGGITWEKVSDGLDGPVDFHSMTVSQANPDIVYGYFRSLQRSLDGGKTWERAKGAVAPFALATHPSEEATVYAATQNGVLRSTDKGDSWKSLSSELEGGSVSVFLLNPDNTALTFSERLGGLGKSADGGVTWEKIDEAFGGGMVMYLARSNAFRTTYALTDQNALYKSTDGGMTWTKVR